MTHIKYMISEIDVYHYAEGSTDIKAQMDAQERGRRLLRDIKTTFPNRERISEHGPHRTEGFSTPRDLSKSYDYHSPNFALSIYKQFEKIPRRGDSIHYLEIIIAAADQQLLDEKKNTINSILDKYNAETGNKIKIEYNEYNN